MAAMQPRKSSGAMRLLIIDDEDNIRRTTAVVLEAMGHADARLSLIVADQAVAALLRGYLADESERVV